METKLNGASLQLRMQQRLFAKPNTQQRLLQEAFDRTSELLLNPVDVAKWKPTNVNLSDDSRVSTDVLWIGRFDSFHKRIDLALEIAKRLPHVRFRFIAQRSIKI